MARMGAAVGGARPAGGAGTASFRRIAESVGPFATVALILIAWEITARREIVMPFLLPAFSTVVVRIYEDVVSGAFFYNLGLTLFRALTAFSIAACVGITIGILMSRVSAVRWFFDPIVSIALPMPKIALLPVFMLWFGLFDTSKIAMVAYSSVFQIIATTWAGTRAVEKELIWSARSLGASEREILREVVLPAALPQILTGLQIALPICLIVVLVTEMVMGGRGLGDAMLMSARYANTPGVFAGILEILFTGFCVIKAMEYARRRLLAWHQEAAR